jgi:hypothetical protein
MGLMQLTPMVAIIYCLIAADATQAADAATRGCSEHAETTVAEHHPQSTAQADQP